MTNATSRRAARVRAGVGQLFIVAALFVACSSSKQGPPPDGGTDHQGSGGDGGSVKADALTTDGAHPDGDALSPADGGQSYTCLQADPDAGEAQTCVVGQTYCTFLRGRDGGAVTFSGCNNLPQPCKTNPTCSCFMMVNCSCTGSGGAFIVTCDPI